ncbi:hypothetical protein LTR64_003817 [Lithohypha guttulata]|uniref:uncharacterized protein n=1 Tax=Lithohypha guttulata TaxID=1690604 RepID=UPI002DDECBC1|nr:hypothetical protein LTR51_006855 [Lithohypha guttulata]
MSQSTISAPSQNQVLSDSQPTDTRKPSPFAKFDNRIAGINDRVLPKQPEEQLQYMSLLLHQEDDEALLKVDGTRIDEEGRLLVHVPSPKPEAPSRPDTPHDSGPKKKISLKDYKTKDRSSVNTPERRPADDIRKQAIKSHKEEEVLVKEEKHQQPSQSTSQIDQKPEQKSERKSEQKIIPSKVSAPAVKPDSKPSFATPTQHDHGSQRPAKKRRLSAEEEKTQPSRTSTPVLQGGRIKQETTEKRSLPALLSPDIPPSQKSSSEKPTTEKEKKRKQELPVLLSPALPPALEKAVAESSQRSDEVRAILKSSIASPARSSDKKHREVAAKEPNRLRADSQASARPTTPGIKISSPVPKSVSALNQSNTSTANSRTASPKPRQRHIIVLKYGKKNRKRVEGLLKFAPRQKKEASTVSEKEKERERSVDVKIMTKVDPPKSDKKRAAESSPEMSTKRMKLEPLIKTERPTTPRLDAEAAKPKSLFSTPKKDLRSIAMQRVASTDTIEAGTPGHDNARNSTPLTMSHTSRPKTSPGPSVSGARTDEQITWNDISTKIFQLGRLLKKEGQKLASESQGKEKQRGVVLLIEALLCFMINSGALAQARPNVDPGWSTILPYYTMVFKQSQSYKHLNGLVVQLGGVCRQHLQQEHVRRLAKEMLPDETVSAPTPGSDGTTRGVDDFAKKQKTFLDLRNELVSNFRDLRLAWLEGSKLLPAETIEQDYPSTWSKRISTKDLSKRNPDKLSPKDLPKDFPMPLDVTANVFEASNFALAFMREWALIEQIDWKTRMEM